MQEQTRTLDQMRQSAARFEEQAKGPIYEPNNEEIEYARQLLKTDKANKDVSLKSMLAGYGKITNKRANFVPYQISVDDAKKLLYIIIQEELREHNRSFAKDGNMVDVLNDLVRYFIGSPDSRLALNKGICLWGDVGIGKTFLFYCISKMIEVLEARYKQAEIYATSRQFRTIHAVVMVIEVAQKKSLDVLKKYEVGNLLIDDLGQDSTHKLYGNETDILADVITQRYIHYQRTKQITHATTNLNPRLWKERYGTRVESRLYDMFNVVGVSGEDKRRI
jgi:DNA replication protein DnaC